MSFGYCITDLSKMQGRSIWDTASHDMIPLAMPASAGPFLHPIFPVTTLGSFQAGGFRAILSLFQTSSIPCGALTSSLASSDSRDGGIPPAFPLLGFSFITLWHHRVPTAAFPTVTAPGDFSFPPIFCQAHLSWSHTSELLLAAHLGFGWAGSSLSFGVCHHLFRLLNRAPRLAQEGCAPWSCFVWEKFHPVQASPPRCSVRWGRRRQERPFNEVGVSEGLCEWTGKAVGSGSHCAR